MDLLSRLSAVLVTIDKGPIWAWVVLAVALSAYVIWTEHRDRKRIGSIFPSVENACIPDDHTTIRLPCRSHNHGPDHGPLIDQ